MKSVLFVLGPFKTQKSPNGICVKHILEKMRIHAECDVLSLEFSNYEDINCEFSICCNDSSSILSPFVYPLRNLEAVRMLYQKTKKLYAEKTYDTIIAVSNPPEAVEAVARLKKEENSFQFIIYEIDSASNRYKNPKELLEKYLMIKAFLWERRSYKLADKIIHMVSHKKHYSANQFQMFENKTIFCDIPGLVIKENNSSCFEHIKAIRHRFLYAGKFYPVLRDPTYMINCMCQYLENKPLQDLVIYSSTMEKEIKTIITRYGIESIQYKTPISQDELDKEMLKYDVLISIGNKNSDFLPSKTINYLAYNKKIIHFYSDDADVSIPYLSKSENCLLIKEGSEIGNVINEINSFLEKDVRYYSVQELNTMYIENTPQYTSDRILELI
nr:hypothetical protein [uncultured Blautia sp.]